MISMPNSKQDGFVVYRFAKLHQKILELNSNLNVVEEDIEKFKGVIESFSKNVSNLNSPEMQAIAASSIAKVQNSLSDMNEKKQELLNDVEQNGKFYRDARTAAIQDLHNKGIMVHNASFIIDPSEVSLKDKLRLNKVINGVLSEISPSESFFDINHFDKNIEVSFPGFFTGGDKAFSAIQKMVSEIPSLKIYGNNDGVDSVLLSDCIDIGKLSQSHDTYMRALSSLGRSVSEPIYQDTVISFVPSPELEADPYYFDSILSESAWELMVVKDFVESHEKIYDRAFSSWLETAQENKKTWDGPGRYL